jgi:hypothetical protein
MSTISWDIAIGVAFVVGLLLFGISSSMLRSARATAPSAVPPATTAPPPSPAPVAVPRPTWTGLVDDELLDADRDLRLDMIERLSIVRSAWSRGILERAHSEERDPDVLAAIDRGLRD